MGFIKAGPKAIQAAAKFFKEKSLDFLAFSRPKRGFSMGYHDPSDKKSFARSRLAD
jgi:hypothetical protein